MVVVTAERWPPDKLYLLYFRHDFIWIPRAGGFHRPSKPQGPRLDLGGFVDHVSVGDIGLAAGGEGPVHAHGVALAAGRAHAQAALHAAGTRHEHSVSAVNIPHGRCSGVLMYLSRGKYLRGGHLFVPLAKL